MVTEEKMFEDLIQNFINDENKAKQPVEFYVHWLWSRYDKNVSFKSCLNAYKMFVEIISLSNLEIEVETKAEPEIITDEVILLFKSECDNKVSTISEKTGITRHQVHRKIDKFLKEKKEDTKKHH